MTNEKKEGLAGSIINISGWAVADVAIVAILSPIVAVVAVFGYTLVEVVDQAGKKT